MNLYLRSLAAGVAVILPLVTLSNQVAGATISHTYDFEGVAAGSDVNAITQPVGLGLSFNNAAFLPKKDIDGIDIPGSEYWQIDTTTSALVTAENTVANGYGVAPSGTQALDGRWSPILLHFAAPVDINAGGFATTLDNSGYGDLWADYILFLDANHNTLSSVTIQESVPGFHVATGNLTGVSEILLPSGAFYDDLALSISTPSAVPEPASMGLLVLGAVGLLAKRRSVR